MAIVATEKGGSFSIPDTAQGTKTIHALSWNQVEQILKQFAKLNPYTGEAERTSILKIEQDNKDTKTNKQRQLWCVAISAKRYVLFLRDQQGRPVLCELFNIIRFTNEARAVLWIARRRQDG